MNIKEKVCLSRSSQTIWGLFLVFFFGLAMAFPPTAGASPAASPVSGFTATALDSSSISLSWTTPSDPDLTEFEIRYSTSPINDGNFTLATQLTNAPQPLPGQTQTMQVSGLSPNTTYYFGIRVFNLASQPSPVAYAAATTSSPSFSGGGSVPACVPPASVSGFFVTTSANVTTLSWATPADPNLAEFEVRYSTSILNDGNFTLATQLTNAPQPLPGQTQTMQVSGLSPNTTYYFGIRVYNICARASSIVYQNSENSGSGSSGGSSSGSGGSMFYNPLPPTNPSIIINGGVDRTASRDVTLTLHAVNASRMALSDTPSFVGKSWEAYAESKPWQLTSGEGTKTVYAMFQSPDGVATKVVSDNILYEVYHPKAPSNILILINGGAATTASRNVTLTLGATDAAEMKISNTDDFSNIAWEPYAPQKAWELTPGDGVKTVFALYRSVDDLTLGPISANITLTVPATTPRASGASSILDFNTIMVNWGSGRYGSAADLNGDERVDNRDVAALMQRWVDITVITNAYAE